MMAFCVSRWPLLRSCVGVLVLLVGCSSAGFTGGANKKAQDKSADAKTPTGTSTGTGTGTHTGTGTGTSTGTGTNNGTGTGTSGNLGTPGHPQACGAAGITQAQLISTSI